MIEEKVLIKNSRGLILAAVIHRPEDDNKHPAVILLHGFTGCKDEAHIKTLASDLALNGIVSIRFDASGAGESEGTSEDDYRFSNYLSDIDDISNYLKTREFADPDRIGIWGHSMGGTLSIIFASSHPIKAVCSVSATRKMETSLLLKEMLPQWKKIGWFTKAGTKIKIPYVFIEDAQKYDVLDYVAKIKKPLFIILGKFDNVVAPEDTRLIYERACEPKILLEISDIGHDYKKYDDKIKLINKEIVSFFHKYL
jgi:esterase/lipase